MDLDDLEHNVLDGVQIASLGGALLAVMAGFGGMRDYSGELAFAPWLPAGLTRLAFPVVVRGRRLQIEVTPQDACYSLRDGTLQISHWGRAPLTDGIRHRGLFARGGVTSRRSR